MVYDAAFLAVAEVAAMDGSGPVEFWTADGELVHSLGQLPEYVRLLGEQPGRHLPPVRHS